MESWWGQWCSTSMAMINSMRSLAGTRLRMRNSHGTCNRRMFSIELQSPWNCLPNWLLRWRLCLCVLVSISSLVSLVRSSAGSFSLLGELSTLFTPEHVTVARLSTFAPNQASLIATTSTCYALYYLPDVTNVKPNDRAALEDASCSNCGCGTSQGLVLGMFRFTRDWNESICVCFGLVLVRVYWFVNL